MKISSKILSVILLLCLLVTTLAACNNTPPEPEVPETKDYVSELKLDMNSSTLKKEVTVKAFIDGDTTHFHVSDAHFPNGVIKARYLAINTPESTGKIEEYGKKASQFTKERLSTATSILIESDTAGWDADSTGDRYLVWVWYKTNESAEYRNLNVELLQNGLAIASSAANNRYGTTCTAAIAQAKAQKLNVHSGQRDPDFYYGDAVELTLRELRCNIESYANIKVAFQGIVVKNDGTSAYVEAYDPETDMYHGIYVYFGFNLSSTGTGIMSYGNEVRVVGTVTYYETGGTYQVSGITYREMKPNDPGNIQKISEGHSPAFVPTDAATFANGKVNVEINEELVPFDYAELAMSTSISMQNLQVVDVYTTSNEDSSSKGAMTLTCTANGVTVKVRTVVLLDQNGELVTADYFQGENINVNGFVDYFSGEYQIKVFSLKDITFNQQ